MTGLVARHLRLERAILLGIERGRTVFAADLEWLEPNAPAELLDGGELISLREAGNRLSHAEAGLAAYLVALLNWHRRHGFCANCGSATEIVQAGLSRRRRALLRAGRVRLARRDARGSRGARGA
ncbi:MAG: NUDIX-like domain-containing protein [Solirubrobacteraceae bacterium]